MTRCSHTLMMFVVGLDFRIRSSAQQQGRSSQVNNTKRQFKPKQPSSRVLGSFRNRIPRRPASRPTIIIRPQLRHPDDKLAHPTRCRQPELQDERIDRKGA